MFCTLDQGLDGKFQAIRILLSEFETGRLEIEFLIKAVRAIHQSMQGSNPQWTEIYEQHWETIEQIYALTPMENELTGARAEVAHNAINGIRSFIDVQLSQM
jgi:hypothetical protein